jgi:hypothetical protein
VLRIEHHLSSTSWPVNRRERPVAACTVPGPVR